MARRRTRSGRERSRGVVQVEQLILVVTVAVVFAAAAAPLGILLFGYHGAVERVLLLPIP